MGSGLRLGEDNGMMRLKKKESKNTSLIDFFDTIAYFTRLKAENKGQTYIIKKCRYFIILRIDCLPAFRPCIPSFHAASASRQTEKA